MPHDALIWKNKFYSIFTIYSTCTLSLCSLSSLCIIMPFFFFLKKSEPFPLILIFHSVFIYQIDLFPRVQRLGVHFIQSITVSGDTMHL